MSKNYTFYLKNEKFEVLMDLEHLMFLIKGIRDELHINGQYIVKSNVSPKTFQIFLDYITDRNKMPEIHVYNIYDLHLLSEEFKAMTIYLSNPEFLEMLHVSILKQSIAGIKDVEYCEKYIAQNLGIYLDKYASEMYGIKENILYNIFFNRERYL